jgi:hypothetical protein
MRAPEEGPGSGQRSGCGSSAIGLYLRLGFRPLFYEKGMRERWDAIAKTIGHGGPVGDAGG